MNIAQSFAEAYLYNEMYNSRFDGGSDISEKITTGGVPVVNLITHNEQSGGAREDSGPLAGIVIPAGLVLDCRRNNRNIEYESHLEKGSSGVISDDLFDRLFDSVSSGKNPRNNTSAKSKPATSKTSSKKKHQK
jgi:hypothetical protein